MTRARLGPSILGVVALLLLLSQPIAAIGPAVIRFHGGSLATPLVVRPAIGSFVFVWAAGSKFYDRATGGTIPAGLEDRRYIEFDVFWGMFGADELKPEAASQHGRVYLPTENQSAVIVSSDIVMSGSDPNATRAPATPVPSQLKDFVSGRALTTSETAALAAAGLPMN